MKRILAVVALVASTVGLTGCLASFDLKDNGNYEQYTKTVVDLAIAAQVTEQTRISALAQIAANADARTQDRVVSELSTRTGPSPSGPQVAAPQQPTNMLLETMRILGPGSLGLVSQGIASWNQNQADQLATQRALAQQQSVQTIITETLNANTGLGLRGMDLAETAVNRIPVAPPSVRLELPATPE
jgi:DNA-directed RNA polymerase specialized sigma subunit